MAVRRSQRRPLTAAIVGRRLADWAEFAARYATADLRPLPDFVILGTQRGGTTSLYRWLSSHPGIAPASKKEVHYFDDHYNRGLRWYRAHFPIGRDGLITGEASPYMLFHPLAPERAARELPPSTTFIVLLREPVERAISQYWYWQKLHLWESESLERALELEEERLEVENERVLRGERSVEHVAYSYVARGEYAPQLRRWFDAVGRDRILVLESEKLFAERETSERVLRWLGVDPHHQPFPLVNPSDGPPTDVELVERLQRHFAPCNQELFELLGRELWTQSTGTPGSGQG